MNNSPWIAQLKRTRPAQPLESNVETDVVIIGGGIAGVTTAYFLLTQTNKNVVLLEGDKIAHGATGHNAGQISSYYEKSFSEMLSMFGEMKAVAGMRIIEEEARVLLESIFSHAELSTPRSEFIGYDACVTYEHVLFYLEDLSLRAHYGLRVRPLLVAKEWVEHVTIPTSYIPYITVTSHANILQILETNDTSYIAAHSFMSGCVNSALFTEEVVQYLLSAFPSRFIVREHTPVSRVVLQQQSAVVYAKQYSITASEVVLCTNGFEYISIDNTAGKNIDMDFHESVMGYVGYMSAYKEPLTKPPFASSYAVEGKHVHDRYFYVTRRPFDDETTLSHNLVCIGGPETSIPNRGMYDKTKEYPLDVSDAIETFSLQTYAHSKEMDYQWHGLMGYTKSGVRIIGREPKNKRLLYNLGCNGVGILTSIYGADRIARIINNEIVEATIFDPR